MVRSHSDRDEYWNFTGPARLHKAVSTLEGILSGVGLDGAVTPHEILSLTDWVEEHRKLAHRHPFNEVLPQLSVALEDGRLEQDERDDLIWLCQKMDPQRGFYDEVTSDMQRLQGVLGGIVADGHVSDEELDGLSRWMEDHEHLRACWPFTELESLLTQVRQDQKVDDEERGLLLSFFREWTTIRGNRALALPLNEVNVPVTGLCAVCPKVVLYDRSFCFTGASAKASRRQFQQIVEDRGGRFSPRVTKELHYLVIGCEGNPCWAFSCYGRKVEQAVALRKEGCKLLLVHEHDFFDAIA